MDLAFISLILFSWADVKGSTTVGTDDRDSPDDSQTALALDANVAIPLSRIIGARSPFVGPQTQLIVGGMGGGFVGSGWDARLDLDSFINGFDTRISGELNGFGGGYAGIRQPIWRATPEARAVLAEVLAEFEIRGGGGAVGSDIQGTTQFGGGNDIRFSEDETLGFVFGEASIIFRRETASGAGVFGKFGVGVMDIEDTSFNVKAPFGDARIDIENDASVFISFEAGLRFHSDRRLKRDIRHVATRSDGLRLYAFKYLWDDTTYVGVMAQDLLRNHGPMYDLANHSDAGIEEPAH